MMKMLNRLNSVVFSSKQSHSELCELKIIFSPTHWCFLSKLNITIVKYYNYCVLLTCKDSAGVVPSRIPWFGCGNLWKGDKEGAKKCMLNIQIENDKKDVHVLAQIL